MISSKIVKARCVLEKGRGFEISIPISVQRQSLQIGDKKNEKKKQIK